MEGYIGPHAFHVSCDSKKKKRDKSHKHLFIYVRNGRKDKSRCDHTEDRPHYRYLHEIAYKQKGGIYMKGK